MYLIRLLFVTIIVKDYIILLNLKSFTGEEIFVLLPNNLHKLVLKVAHI